jgi:hypothetical protein
VLFFNVFCVYKKFNPSIKFRYKKLLQDSTRDWITEKEKEGSTSMEDPVADHQPTPRGPKNDPPGRLLADFSKRAL